MAIMDKINSCRHHQHVTKEEARAWCGGEFGRLPVRGSVHVRVNPKTFVHAKSVSLLLRGAEYLWSQSNGEFILSREAVG